ncbi:methyl-accepting chemotaxis protein [Clostridium intestinale]|uniref:Methyl-accepting chemotaxis protein n=1 Tax=Clostridium intestinale URNW TaxID=1294142 RepID=U2NJV0_9CLOT|nr:methyl-accepting chemotaxis protein [Clostridium intestinale]ERK29121.1 methyl-accepting chemotaxis protein [Clostridium intestinale URNW]
MIKKSIRNQLLIPIISMIILLVSVLSYVAISESKKHITNNSERFLMELTNEKISNINNIFNDNLTSMWGIVNSQILKDGKTPWETLRNLLDSQKKSRDHISIGIIDESGNIKYSDDTTGMLEDKELLNRVLNGEGLVKKVGIDGDNNPIFSYLVPIVVDGRISKILVVNRIEPELSRIVKEEVSGYGAGIILNEQGIIQIHTNNEFIGKKLSELDDNIGLADIEQKMIKGEVSSGEYKLNNKDNMITYGRIKVIGWSFGQYLDKQGIQQEVDELSKYFSALGGIVAVIGVLTALIIINLITRNLKKIDNHMTILSTGDLTKGVEENLKKRRDEVGDIANAINKTQQYISEIISLIKINSDSIDMKSENLSNISSKFVHSTENIAHAVEEVASGSDTQAQELTDTVEIVNKFGRELDKIVVQFEEINTRAVDIDEKAKKSNNSMEMVVQGLLELIVTFSEFKEKINSMDKNIKKVNEFTSLIKSISEQTNLLALNAAIEAAAAGDAGKGFGVVADEVRTLAEKSKTASNKIFEIASDLLKDTRNISSTSEKMNNEIVKQRETIDTSMTSFKEISSSIEEITPRINNVSRYVERLSSNKDDIVIKSENVASISQEISSLAQEISASMEEMKESSLDVSITSKDLKDMTAVMKENVGIFKIE